MSFFLFLFLLLSDLVRFQLSFQVGNYFSSLSNHFDGNYCLSASSNPSVFTVNNLSLTLQWRNSSNFTTFAPTITAVSASVLTSGDSFYSYVNIPSDCKSYWVTLSGFNADQLPDLVSVSYKTSSMDGTTFPFVTNTDPTFINDRDGNVSPSSIVWRTTKMTWIFPVIRHKIFFLNYYYKNI